MNLSAAATAAIRAHAEREYPREACGVLAVVKGRRRYFPCRNLAATPGEHFILSPEDYAAAEDKGAIVAIVHSHPDASAAPSDADRVGCEGSGLPWLIVSVGPGPVAEIMTTTKPKGYTAPLVGRQFAHGVLDCYTLLRDWYAQERGIALPDFDRRDEWWNDGHSDLYTAHFAEAGFAPVEGGDLQPGDVILMQVQSRNRVPNHAAIYLGDGLMLHHLYGRLSSRDVYGGWYAEVTRMVVRYSKPLLKTGSAKAS